MMTDSLSVQILGPQSCLRPLVKWMTKDHFPVAVDLVLTAQCLQ